MEWCFFYLNILLLLHYSDSGSCISETYGTDPQNNAAVRSNEESNSDTGVLVSLDDYVITCDCGVLTEWSFYAKRSGTTHFFVSRGGTIVGSTSVYVAKRISSDTLSDNYYHIALSSEVWISVQKDDKLGFFTEGDPPMITYEATTANATRATGIASLPGSVSGLGSQILNRKYAVMAKVEAAKPPFFLNLPYTTTLYRQQTSTVVHTVSVTDLDPQDVNSLIVTKTAGIGEFAFDPATKTVTYGPTAVSSVGSPYIVQLTVQDPCGFTDVQTITINIIDEPLYFTNLPAGGATIDEGGNKAGLPFTISVTDPTGDTVTCSLNSVVPPVGTALFTFNAFTIDYDASAGPPSYATSRYYDLLISCSDDANTVYSNFVVDIVKNEPPVITNLPDSVLSVDTTNIPATIFTVTATDPEADVLLYSLTCTTSSGAACPAFNIDGAGVITVPSLPDAGYDIVVTVDDNNGNTDTGKLTVTVTGFTASPSFTNLPATRNLVEGTPAGTYLYTVNYKDENIFNTFTLTKGPVSDPLVDTYFDFNVATGVITLKADFDFEALNSTSGLTMDITVTDDSGETDTGTMTFNFENKNEAPTITIGTAAIAADEGPKDTVFTPDPLISGTDLDAGDTALLTFSMNCGAFSKYFYLNDADKQIYFSREYDLDSGLASSVTCDVTVMDPKGLKDTGSIALTINYVNDNKPRFTEFYYTFFLKPTDTFMTQIADLEAYDNDSTNDVLTYAMANGKSGTTPDDYFMIDASGILYVRDVSSFALGSTYHFDVTVTDTDVNPSVLSGSAQVFIIFSGVADPDATTTTERSFTFPEDNENYFWLTIVGVVVLALLIVIVFIIYLDPPVRKAIARRILRHEEERNTILRETTFEDKQMDSHIPEEWFQELFQEKPKEPKRYPVGKLKVEIGHKVLENDPESKLPWEFKPSAEKVEDKLENTKEKMKPVKELKIISGVPRGTSVEVDVHSSDSGGKEGSQNNSDDGAYASSEEEENAGADQWGDLAVGGASKGTLATGKSS